MRIRQVSIRNFRRLEKISIDFDEKSTIFVGPNNSGKTSATAIFRCFLGGRAFKVHDFSIACISEFEKFVTTGDSSDIPDISLDLWFSIDPNTIAFGRVFSLLPHLSDTTQVGIRISLALADNSKLREEYTAAYPANAEGVRTKTLYQYLAMDGNLGRHYATRYASLESKPVEGGPAEITLSPVEPEEGKRLIKNLVRVEFVDAQRNITDDDSSRSNRLSTAFAAYYRNNLTQIESAVDANKVIDENNTRLTVHYEKQFKPLIDLIQGLGVPSVNDRSLRLVSSLSPETALRGSTELLYIDPKHQHELPELYNGLGFKNLIYMAIQARHFHSQWLMTAENRPMCLLIFIEEPEVHLHAQVQQTFISNIWSVIKDSAEDAQQSHLVPQLVVTTHSSHILDAVDFETVRYFQRCHVTNEEAHGGIRNASNVVSLRYFRPETEVVDDVVIQPDESIAFLKKYLRLTHCDLFFADAAILVEGAVEKLLMPSMIEKTAHRLRSTYLTVLEVGGAYAHRFEGLLAFLKIPYLVVTDLDSVEPTGNRPMCRADTDGAHTSNATLKKLCGKTTIQELITLSQADKISESKKRCISYQMDVSVMENDVPCVMRPRTLEEAIAYENFKHLRSGGISVGLELPKALADAYQKIYDRIRSSNFKKTDFAMSLLACKSDWTVPTYIADGLKWLESQLCDLAPAANAADAASVSVGGLP